MESMNDDWDLSLNFEKDSYLVWSIMLIINQTSIISSVPPTSKCGHHKAEEMVAVNINPVGDRTCLVIFTGTGHGEGDLKGLSWCRHLSRRSMMLCVCAPAAMHACGMHMLSSSPVQATDGVWSRNEVPRALCHRPDLWWTCLQPEEIR